MTTQPQNQDLIESPWATAGAIGLPALITFLMARRIRPGILGNRIASKIRERGLVREVLKGEHSGSNLMNYLQFGTETRPPGWVKSKQWNPKKIKGIPEIYFSPNSEDPIVQSKIRGGTLGRGEHMKDITSKRLEAKIFRKAAPGIYPTTILGNEIPNRVFKTKDPIEKAKRLEKHFKKKLGKKWIMKGTEEQQTAGTLITDQDDLREILAGTLALNPKSRLKVHRTIMDKLLGRPETITYKKLQKLPKPEQIVMRQRIEGLHQREMMKELLNRKNRKNMMIQSRFPIQKLGPLDELANIATTGQPAKMEVRVHAIGKKVIPETTANRFGGISELSSLIGQRPDYFDTAESAVAKALHKAQKINPKYVKNRMFAFDVAITPKGKAKIIESNPEAFSGMFHRSPQLKGLFDPVAAIHSHKLVSALQGQDTLPIAGAKALLAGGLGYGGLTALREVTE